jgi:aspartate/methionine/tyrosine aminotransferase
VGTPFDEPPTSVVEVLQHSHSLRGYPPSVGTQSLLEAAGRWFETRFDVSVQSADIGACVGTKELVVGLPHWLKLRTPGRDTVLYPEISYPSYAMGAELAGCRAVPVRVDPDSGLDVDSIDAEDGARALCLWVNTPGNPAGGLDDLAAVAAWGRANGVPVLSDECYVEFTWRGPGAMGRPPGQTILSEGLEGVLAVHSLSKRSNLAGLRVGFYAGDPDLVHYLREVRKHNGLMVPGPVQEAGTAALNDQAHVELQRERYHSRLQRLSAVLEGLGLSAPLPGGGFYLWVPAPGGDAWALAEQLARHLGIVGSPGEFYGPAGSGHLRLAVVQGDEAFERIEERAGGLGGNRIVSAP